MTNNSGKIKTYVYSSIALSALLTALYSLSYLLAFDADIGYFSSTSILPIIAGKILIVSLIWVFTLFIFLPRAGSSDKPLEMRSGTRVSAAFAAAALALYALWRLIFDGNALLDAARAFYSLLRRLFDGNAILFDAPILPLAAVPLAALAAFYFLLIALRGSRLTHAVTGAGYFVIFWATAAMTEVYTDQFVAMNSPLKISFMTAMMSLMLFMLYELRYLIGRSKPRAYLVSTLAGIMLNAVFSIPVILLTFAGSYNTSPHLPAAAVSLVLCGYMTVRLFDFISHYCNKPAFVPDILSNCDHHNNP